MRKFSEKQILKTKLFNFHSEFLKASSWAEFANYKMPIKYKEYGLIKEHLAVRQKCGFFDVSHMGQLRIKGKDSDKFLERITTNKVAFLENGNACLSLILNNKGGIIDDTIVSKLDNHYYNMVLNAGNKNIDIKHFNEIKENEFKNCDLKFDYLNDYSLIAIQGPKSMEILQNYIKTDLKNIGFMNHFKEIIKINGKEIELFIIRAGYTGEDGFEISIKDDYVEEFSEKLFNENSENLVPAGLGARDSTRLEAGLCLHGNEMNTETTPVESMLQWTLRKENKFVDYIGYENVLKAKENKPKFKRFGFVMKDSKIPVARTNTEIFLNDQKVGYVTSGIFSPSLEKNIGMGYIKSSCLFKSFKGQLFVKIRNKNYEIEIKKMPLINSNYYRII